jgi:bifunctional DNase/RNase
VQLADRIGPGGLSAPGQKIFFLKAIEDAEQRCRLAVYVSPHEAHRLAHELGRARCAGTPVYDFIQALMDAVHAPMTHVVLDDTEGKGVSGFIYCRRAESEVGVPCYIPDALALALRMQRPIYATAEALVHAEPLLPAASAHGEPSDVQQWLAQVRPEDFSSHREDRH